MRWVRGEEEELFFPVVLPAKLKSWHMPAGPDYQRRSVGLLVSLRPLSTTRNAEMSFGSCTPAKLVSRRALSSEREARWGCIYPEAGSEWKSSRFF